MVAIGGQHDSKPYRSVTMRRNEMRRSQRVNVTLRDAEWQQVEAALEITSQRPTEFVRQAALEQARRVLAAPEQYGISPDPAEAA